MSWYVCKKSIPRITLIGFFFVSLLLSVVVGYGRSGSALASGFPTHYFAPYVDVSTYPTFPLTQTFQLTGSRLYTLAFIIAGDGCQAAWGGTKAMDQRFLLDDITHLRAQGGDIAVSFGGQAGTELALTCHSVSALQAQYQAVIDTYNVTHLDFDIEGDAIADRASIDLRNQAIAGLQVAAQNAGRMLSITYTLPASLVGLTHESLTLLQNALINGTIVNVINIMAMDYGDRAVPNQMGLYAIQVANGLFGQLQMLYPVKTATQLWSMIGVTPMLGWNDVIPEVFTLQDAQQLLQFAQEHTIAMLAMWSGGRDMPCANGENYVSSRCSGLQQVPFAFTTLLSQFSQGSAAITHSESTATVVASGPTAIPHPTSTPPPWSTNNLITNGGFEKGGLSNWQSSSSDTLVSNPVHTGKYALQLAATDATTGQCQQTMVVKPNHTYILQVYVKGSSAFIGVVGYSEVWTTSHDYTPLRMTFMTSAAVRQVTIYIHGWYGRGTIYADDFSLIE